MNKTITKQNILKIGFLVNPYAGAGGPAARKGSDEASTRDAVVRGDISQRSPERAQQFLAALADHGDIKFVTARRQMGEFAFAQQKKLVFECVDFDTPDISSADDTKAITQLLMDQNVDLIVFVGGDGTARDVCSVVQHATPVLGIPSGVKMHSGVFAITPTAAAKVIDEVVSGQVVSIVEREVRDIDEDAFREGIVKSRYFGSMWVPEEIRYIQSVKQGGVEVDELVLVDIAAEIRDRIDDLENVLVIFGTGSTVQFVQQELGVPGTLLGVDLAINGCLIQQDIDAQTLDRYIEKHKGLIVLILTVIGGQGHIIGRGNQQISPSTLKKLGRENLWVVATKSKLKALEGRPLLMDSNDPQLDRDWQGLIPVITGYQDQVIYRLGIDDA